MERKFAIDERGATDDGAVILALAGELDLATADTLAERLEAEARDHRSVLRDLSELEFIDSSGLRVLLRASGDASRDGWRFAISGPSPRIRRVFEVAGVQAFLPLVDR